MQYTELDRQRVHDMLQYIAFWSTDARKLASVPLTDNSLWCIKHRLERVLRKTNEALSFDEIAK